MHTAKVVLHDAYQPELVIDCKDAEHGGKPCPLQEQYRYDGWDAVKIPEEQVEAAATEHDGGVVVMGEFPVHYEHDGDDGWVVYGKGEND